MEKQICPCKTAGLYCTVSCACGTRQNPCKNQVLYCALSVSLSLLLSTLNTVFDLTLNVTEMYII